MRFALQRIGQGHSFLDADAFLPHRSNAKEAEIVIYSGVRFEPDPTKAAILIELQHECLGEHVNEEEPGQTNVLGFARYRNGDDPPTKLVELVRHSKTSETATIAARELFSTGGLEVAVCSDQAGRIISRLAVPKYNAALRFLDEGLASPSDMDLTCKLGLGYSDGPIERVMRGGLANHYRTSKALFEVYGTPAYLPPRRAIVAFRREMREVDQH